MTDLSKIEPSERAKAEAHQLDAEGYSRLEVIARLLQHQHDVAERVAAWVEKGPLVFTGYNNEARARAASLPRTAALLKITSPLLLPEPVDPVREKLRNHTHSPTCDPDELIAELAAMGLKIVEAD